MSTEVAGGFTGRVIGLYAADGTVHFDWFDSNRWRTENAGVRADGGGPPCVRARWAASRPAGDIAAGVWIRRPAG
ncbi:hypothetical protein AB0D86_43265 [Streptomyces sp. NPDC048324]|uniref:hypothetical protein n=1 Tax=Streptomyces sp. NPDC048324 TaxID=3157205 RepID=UPI003431340E